MDVSHLDLTSAHHQTFSIIVWVLIESATVGRFIVALRAIRPYKHQDLLTYSLMVFRRRESVTRLPADREI